MTQNDSRDLKSTDREARKANPAGVSLGPLRSLLQHTETYLWTSLGTTSLTFSEGPLAWFPLHPDAVVPMKGTHRDPLHTSHTKY